MLLYEDHQPEVIAQDGTATPPVITSLAFTGDCEFLASGSQIGSVFLSGIDGQSKCVMAAQDDLSAAHSLCPLDDGNLVIGHDEGYEILYRLDNGTQLVSKQVFGKKVGLSSGMRRGTAFSRVTSVALIDRDIVAVGSQRGFQLHDLHRVVPIPPAFPIDTGVRSVASAQSKKMVAWATGNRQVTVWEIHKQDQRQFPQPKQVNAISLSPAGTDLIVAVDYDAKVYDLVKNREAALLKGHKGRVTCIAVSPDNSTVATGSWDKTVRIWDLSSGRLRQVFEWPIGRVTALAYAPDGLRLAAGGDTGRVVVWDTD